MCCSLCLWILAVPALCSPPRAGQAAASSSNACRVSGYLERQKVQNPLWLPSQLRFYSWPWLEHIYMCVCIHIYTYISPDCLGGEHFIIKTCCWHGATLPSCYNKLNLSLLHLCGFFLRTLSHPFSCCKFRETDKWLSDVEPLVLGLRQEPQTVS